MAKSRKSAERKASSKTPRRSKKKIRPPLTKSHASERKRSQFPIAGIGASAGGLEAIQGLLKALPQKIDMAFVIVQHLDPTHESLGPEILSRATQMPVHEAKDGMRVESGNVYTIPPNTEMTLYHGVLNLVPQHSGQRGQPVTVDSFLQSLALERKEGAIGIILSGTASDGTLGLEAIRAEGGLTIAQDPKSARHRGMPESAIASGSVDLILSPPEIAKELARISNHSYVKSAGKTDATPTPSAQSIESTRDQNEPNSALRAIFALLRAHTKVDFSSYKHTTILRRIQRRMLVRKCDSLDAYAKFIQANPGEVKELYEDFLINVTEFFRDEDSFNALRDQVFPELIKNRHLATPIRIWVPGCSTGEEAYSVAILLLEFLGSAGVKFPIQIFGTDISEQAILKARQGAYPSNIERKLNKERLELFFEKKENGYKISKSVRDLCLFSKHDLTCDPPFSKLDLISCRNVFIYLDSGLQRRVFPIFHFALNPGGYLFLGRSEGLSGSAKLFSALDRTHKIFTRSNFTLSPLALRASMLEAVPEVSSKKTVDQSGSNVQREVERIGFSRYAPPSVVVNADMDILQFQGRTSPYLETVAGPPSRNLFKMARSEIAHALRVAIRSAVEKSAPARQESLSFSVEGKERTVSIEVVPTNSALPPSQRNYVVFFEEEPPHPSSGPSLAPGNIKKGTKNKIVPREHRDLSSQRALQLEEELAASKLAQVSLSEEFDTIQEELTSANEELQSTNEELQSTNEELETSKEELQSSNEELTTVNEELQNRNTDLVVVSSDLSNVFSNIEIPIVIVGIDRRIRRFTPKAESVFNLIATDVGRPLNDIRPNFECNLDSLVAHAIESLTLQENEVLTRNARWMRVQVRPYRTIDNRIDGAVISLVDITLIKEHLNESQRALKYATSVADTLHLPLVVLDQKLCLLSANVGFTKTFEIMPDKNVGRDFFTLLGGKGWKVPDVRRLLENVINKNEDLKNFEIEIDVKDLGGRIILLNAKKIDWDEVMPTALLMSIDDVTERRTLERNVERSEIRFRTLFESAHDAILILSVSGKIEFANKKALELFGDGPNGLEGNHFETLIPERFRKTHSKNHQEFMRAPKARPMGEGLELFCLRSDGSEIPVDVSLSPMKTASEISVAVIIRNISEPKKLSLERKKLLEQEKEALSLAEQARAEAERANETKDNFLATLSHELRTPLTSILSWAQMAQRQKFDSSKWTQAMQIIEQSAKTQGQLIDDLLDISRIQSGKLAINFGEVDPAQLTNLTIDGVRPLAEKKHITIELDTNLSSERIWGDSERLQQVVWNLLTNAIKFSNEGGTINVRVEPAINEGKKFVSIKVIDHGKGMPAEFLPKLFQRFHQADSSSVRVHGGLGLGLAIVRELTQLHGGLVRAESQGLGHGSTFIVLLPVKSDATTWTKDTIDSAIKIHGDENDTPDLTGLKIMIVEDELGTLEALAEVLGSFGATVMPCDSVAKALAAFEQFRPEVLVSDIAMPGEDGYSLIRKIRKLEPAKNGDVKALALTAYATEGDLKKALGAGFNGHMAKPFDSKQLGLSIARLAKKPANPQREE